MTADGELRTRAETLLQQRSMDNLVANITDPKWQAKARDFTSGRMTARDFVRELTWSPAGIRAFDRFLKQLTTLSTEQWATVRAHREQQIQKIIAEISPTSPAEEESRENQTWMVSWRA